MMMLAKNYEFQTTEPCSEMKCAKWKIRFDDLIFSLVFVGMFRTRCILFHNYLDFMRSSILYFNDVKSDKDLFKVLDSRAGLREVILFTERTLARSHTDVIARGI